MLCAPLPAHHHRHPSFLPSASPSYRPRSDASTGGDFYSISQHQDFNTETKSSILPSRSPEPYSSDSSSEVSSAQQSNYHYVPRGQLDALTSTSDNDTNTMYHHHVHSSSATQNLLYPDPSRPLSNPAVAHPQQQQTSYPLSQSHSRRSPPSNILTDNLVASASDSELDAAPYSASPISSPSDILQSQHAHPPFSFPPPMSAPHSQTMFSRFPHNGLGADPSVPNTSSSSRYPFATLDRRMSEPVLGARASYPQPAAHGHSQVEFAYSASAASSASTIHIAQPPLSPRPSSSQYSSYSSYSNQGGHHRAGSGASDTYGAAAEQNWQLKSELELEAGDGAGSAIIGVAPAMGGSPVSPLYAASAASGSDASVQGLSSPRSPQHLKQQPQTQNRVDPSRSGNARNSKTYSFVSLPGNAVKKRPRRRYDEIERLYHCNWPNCNKAYGTLNHLNAHVTMQKHGAKRSPGEFKELRKQWRQAKKEADEQVREREREVQTHTHQHSQHPHMIPHPSHGYPHEFDHHTLTSRHTRRRSLDPYPDPHGMPPHHGYSLPSPMSATFPSSSYGLAGPGLERYGMPSPTEIDELRYPEEDPGLYRSSHHQPSQHAQGPMHGDNSIGGWPQSDLRHGHPSSLGQLNVGTPRGASAHSFYNPASQAPTLPPAHTFLASPASPGLLGQPPLPAGHAQGQFSAHQQEQELPQLAAHVSLGHNRLPPDSTLLTALPGYNQGDDGLGRGYD